MKEYGVFDIVGPCMIGPSSSHTAGAARLGQVGYRLAGGDVKRAHVTLYGSFAKTGRGHGTDRAIIGGLLGLEPDDIKIRTSLEIAHREKRDFTIDWSEEEVSHPNTAKIQVENSDGKNFEIIGSSVGGGNIEIQKVNGMEVSFSCSHPTLLVFHQDQPGVIAAVTGSLAIHRINVAFMKVFRHSKRQHACMAIETDETVVPELIDYIKRLSPEITEVCAL